MSNAALVTALAIEGIGVAFVQAAATSATRSAVGRVGTGIDLFNLLR